VMPKRCPNDMVRESGTYIAGLQALAVFPQPELSARTA
jgi:hypothetical protein